MISRRITSICAFLACANGIVFVVESFWYTPFQVPSASMEPYLQKGDHILVKRSVPFESLERGDVIVFRGRSGSFRTSVDVSREDALVKRVVALPGETIQGADGFIALNRDTRLTEPYAHDDGQFMDFGPEFVPDGTVWVMGDNRANSRDSRFFGPVPERAYLGVAEQRYWPRERAGKLG